MHLPPALAAGTVIHNELEVLDVLGVGAYGRVYLAKDMRSKKLYAIKSLYQRGLDHRQCMLQRNELTLHAQLSHPHIVRLERIISEKPDYVHIVLEYCPEGDLFSAITDRDLYYGNHDLIRSVFLQLLDAVRYCHAHNVYHRDLKPENILVFNGGKTVKLTDFGLATRDSIANDYGCGSIFYFSPECQGDLSQRSGYATVPNDIWSLGIVLVNLATSRNPWREACIDDDMFRSYLADRDYLLKLLPISRELNRILKRILCIDPMRRISLDELAEEIRNCKYFTRTEQVEQLEIPSRQRLQNIFPPSPPTTPRADISGFFSSTTCVAYGDNTSSSSPPPSPTSPLVPSLNKHSSGSNDHHHHSAAADATKMPPSPNPSR
ncbi:hypothetical protein VTP01DRAFT_7946, partial [Rhizomucor pusillus]|uniref:uncharacterized protein n=1 Tax=Rhizomucor pusillus TaxID=4840 RepID=UPI00374322D6